MYRQTYGVHLLGRRSRPRATASQRGRASVWCHAYGVTLWQVCCLAYHMMMLTIVCDVLQRNSDGQCC